MLLTSLNAGNNLSAGETIFSLCGIGNRHNGGLVFLDAFHCNASGSIHLFINLVAATAAPDSLPIRAKKLQRIFKIRVVIRRASQGVPLRLFSSQSTHRERSSEFYCHSHGEPILAGFVRGHLDYHHPSIPI